MEKDTCKQCLKGTWSAAGADVCQVCPAGTRAVNRLSCKDCRPGKYSTISSDLCTPCGPGKVSEARAAKCTICKAGEYASYADNKCKPCPKNTISVEAADSCTPCAAGSYSGPGGSQCSICAPGQYYDATRLCVDCLPSFYSPNPNSICKKCPKGRYSGIRASLCLFCPKGQSVNIAQTGCQPASTPSPAPSPTTPPPYPSCPDGSEYDKALQYCVLCKAGYYVDGKNRRCVLCPPQHFSSTAGYEGDACFPCERVVNADRTACEDCNPPNYMQEYLRGNFTVDFAKPNDCRRCPANTYSRAYTNNCFECPSGSVVNAAQSGCEPSSVIIITDPKTCGPGSEYDENTKKCKLCEKGYFKQFSFQPKCLPCMVGFIAETRGKVQCSRAYCDAYDGHVIDPVGQYCTTCEASYYKHIYPLGEFPYTNAKNAECLKCPKGTYAPGGSLRTNHCFSCPKGIETNAEQTGCVGWTPTPTSNPTRKVCEPGYEPRDHNTCVKCDPGFAPYYHHACYPCRAGTYTPDFGSTMCKKCEAPKVVKGWTTCEYCPPSFYYQGYPNQQNYPFEREADCLKCAAGTYSGFEDSGCHTCAQGTVVNSAQTGCI